MVSPADDALRCSDCHTRDDGRLASLAGFYLPGRDFNKPVDRFGTWLLRLSLLLIGAHILARIVTAIRYNRIESENINHEDYTNQRMKHP
jgi:hypothetical protein